MDEQDQGQQVGEPVFLAPEVTVFAHEIDVAKHPTYGPGWWRWAVMVGGRPPHELEFCATAGGLRSLADALQRGDEVAAGIIHALRIFGHPVKRARSFVLDHDPVPAGGDIVHDLRR